MLAKRKAGWLYNAKQIVSQPTTKNTVSFNKGNGIFLSESL